MHVTDAVICANSRSESNGVQTCNGEMQRGAALVQLCAGAAWALSRRTGGHRLANIAHQLHRHVAATGKPPALVHFFWFATVVANHWAGGYRAALCTAIGEPAPSEQKRPARLVTGDVYDVVTGTGRSACRPLTWSNSPEETQQR